MTVKKTAKAAAPAKKAAKAAPIKKTTAKATAPGKKADFESLSVTAANPRFFDDPSAQVSLRVSAALKAAIKTRAKSKGLSEAGYLRMLLIEDVSR